MISINKFHRFLCIHFYEVCVLNNTKKCVLHIVHYTRSLGASLLYTLFYKIFQSTVSNESETTPVPNAHVYVIFGVIFLEISWCPTCCSNWSASQEKIKPIGTKKKKITRIKSEWMIGGGERFLKIQLGLTSSDQSQF